MRAVGKLLKHGSATAPAISSKDYIKRLMVTVRCGSKVTSVKTIHYKGVAQKLTNQHSCVVVIEANMSTSLHFERGQMTHQDRVNMKVKMMTSKTVQID